MIFTRQWFEKYDKWERDDMESKIGEEVTSEFLSLRGIGYDVHRYYFVGESKPFDKDLD